MRSIRVVRPALERVIISYEVPQTCATHPGSSPADSAIEMNVSRMLYFRHYRTWIPGLNPDSGIKVGPALRWCTSFEKFMKQTRLFVPNARDTCAHQLH